MCLVFGCANIILLSHLLNYVLRIDAFLDHLMSFATP